MNLAWSVLLFICLVVSPSFAHLREAKRGLEIVGGTKADKSQLPFVCWLNVGHTLCGATLIAEGRFLLTAAHCFDRFPPTETDLSKISCRAGMTRLSSSLDDEYVRNSDGGQQRFAESYSVHKSYRITDDQVKYDIAVIKLSEPFHLDESVSAVSIAHSLPNPGETCYVAGWGLTAEGGQLSNDLMYVGLPFVDFETCNDQWENSLFQDTQICAGGVFGRDGCQGDSGSALFVTSNISKTLDAKVIGIASFGADCGSTTAGVYTNVVEFGAKWIKEQIAILDPEYSAAKSKKNLKNWTNVLLNKMSKPKASSSPGRE